MPSQVSCGATPTHSSGPRWVDLIGSDDDTLSGPEDCLAPITEDSYQGQPNAALDGSKDAPLKNLRLDGPLDFGFLFQNPKLKDEEFPVLKPREATPTVLEIAKSINFDGTDSTTNTTISTPTTTTPPPERSGHGRSKGKFLMSRGKRNRCRAVSTDTETEIEPELQKAKKNRMGSSDSLNSDVMANESRTRATSTITEASTATSSMPEATEEEWQHRIEHRMKMVETGRSTLEYKKYLEAIPKEARGEGRPMTPDPYDRTMSKRTFKTAVNEWRRSLKAMA
eukprot:gnl/MRDRNA2_/MRDRNA2_155579_c0_seq1.p1 gnl/MRDRNA2_/MRDRNA2_155579_c0~~gnl/MRDRNA2_/MRDRNA2_155579_c0_seq1.p1  ORF type:complete len:282 (+),score=47.40 gnl/MRDRNA2_/MRDRNA2_155579_c0_seq1:122-967(+)